MHPRVTLLLTSAFVLTATFAGRSAGEQPAAGTAATVKVDTVVTTYYGGQTQERYTAYKNKKKQVVIHGAYALWNEEGNKVLECEYVHGKRQGAYRSFYNSGTLEMECEYVDDKQAGKAVWYYETGERLREETWVDGVKSGPEVQFYESGKTKFEGTYEDGLPHGKFDRYYPNGDHEAIGEYSHGKLVSETKEFPKAKPK